MAVVVAQLVEQLFPIPEVRGSNPVISKKLYWIFTVNCIQKTKIKKKEAGNGPFIKSLKNDFLLYSVVAVVITYYVNYLVVTSYNGATMVLVIMTLVIMD